MKKVSYMIAGCMCLCIGIGVVPATPSLADARSYAMMKSADSLFAAGEVDSAAILYRQTIANKDLFGYRAWIGLGRIFLDRKAYDTCIVYMKKAYAANEKVETLELAYYLGTCYGRTGQYEKAVTELSKGGVLEGDESLKRTMKGQKAFYESRLFEEIAKNAAAQESTGKPAVLNDSLIAVVPFKNVSNNAQFAPLQKGLADMVITDLAQVQTLRVVERMQVNRLMQELALDQAGLTENKERERIASLLAASRIITGMFTCPDSLSIKIDGGYFDMGAQNAVAAKPAEGTLKRFFEVEKAFVFSLVDRMGITLTDKEREDIQKIPTENLLAFMAYSQGLDAQDRGDFKGAQKAFEKAATLDPSFTQAGELSEVMGSAARMEESAGTGTEQVTEPVPVEPDAGAAEPVPVEETPVVYEGSGPGAVIEESQSVSETTVSSTRTTASAGTAPSQTQPAAATGTALPTTTTTSTTPSRTQSTVAISTASSQTLLDASSDVGRRMSTLAGGSFMPEVEVQTVGVSAETEEQEQQDNTTVQESQSSVDNPTNLPRADYAEFRGLGFGEATTEVPLIIELPEVP